MEIEREQDGQRGRYVARLDGHEAELTYTLLSARALIADHTGVPDAIGGRGVGQALVERLVADARAEDLKIVPRCAFVDAMRKRHPDWADVFEV